jgi:prepilin-type N-terminal cleavage/methylation domain-containing protein
MSQKHLAKPAQARRPKNGFSLVEMILATALLAGTLAPALTVMRNAMSISRESARRALLANYAVEALEYAQGVTMQSWTTGTTTGNFASDGYPTLLYSVTRSDAPAGGGITGRLMHVQAVLWDDVNGNSTLDSSEIAVRMRTKVAKLTTYQSVAN